MWSFVGVLVVFVLGIVVGWAVSMNNLKSALEANERLRRLYNEALEKLRELGD